MEWRRRGLVWLWLERGTSQNAIFFEVIDPPLNVFRWSPVLFKVCFDSIQCCTTLFGYSNIWPLWCEAYDETKKHKFDAAAVRYIQKQNLESFPGGVPTSLVKTLEQWDFPNCWPPLEHVLVLGLEKTNLPEAKSLAFTIAEKRVLNSHLNFQQHGHMYEKVYISM